MPEPVMASHKPRKRFGQNFLHDISVLQHIIAVIDPRTDDHIVEIGPGKGILTQPLLDQSDHVEVIELDRDLVVYLHEKFAATKSLQIYSADALTFDYCRLATAPKKLRIVGNLPYNISTPLMFHLLEYTACIGDMHFMLQKEVADRLAAQPGTAAYGRLSLMIQYHFIVERLFIVSPGSFNPVPKVDSAFIRLVPHSQPPVHVADQALFKQLISQAFSQRRKTIRNSLKGTLTTDEIVAANIDPGLRAEALSLAEFARLSNTVSDSNRSLK